MENPEFLEWQHRQHLLEVGRRRADALIALLPHLVPKGHTVELLEAAREIPTPWGSGRVLVALLPYLEQPMKEFVCDEVLSKGSSIEISHRGALELLIKVLPYISASRMEAILDTIMGIARQMSKSSSNDFELGELAHLLAERDYRQEALVIVKMIKNKNDRERARVGILNYLVKHLVEQGVLKDALEMVRTVDYDLWRAWLIAAIVPLIPENLRLDFIQEGLKSAYAIQIENRYMAVGPLLPYLPKSQREQILEEIIDSILKDEVASFRTQKLCGILTKVTEPDERDKIFSLALDSASSITVPVWKATELLNLVLYDPPEVISEIFETAEQIDDNMQKAEILAALLPYLSEPQRTITLSKVLDILRLNIRMTWLWPKISAYMDETESIELGKQLLDYAAETSNLSSQALALKDLSSHLPEVLLMRAFYIAANIGNL